MHHMPKTWQRCPRLTRTIAQCLCTMAFSKWGTNIICPFTPRKGQVKFLLVEIDYFSKWIELEPLATIMTQHVQHFMWKNIVYRYGVPHTIITDNRWQFIYKGLVMFYSGLNIKHKTSLVEHPSPIDKLRPPITSY